MCKALELYLRESDNTSDPSLALLKECLKEHAFSGWKHLNSASSAQRSIHEHRTKVNSKPFCINGIQAER
jgi:hypothetical protein